MPQASEAHPTNATGYAAQNIGRAWNDGLAQNKKEEFAMSVFTHPDFDHHEQVQ